MTSQDIMASIKKIERLAQNMADAYLASDADEIVDILNDIDSAVARLGEEYGSEVRGHVARADSAYLKSIAPKL